MDECQSSESMNMAVTQNTRNLGRDKLEFHDADTDTDIIARIIARVGRKTVAVFSLNSMGPTPTPSTRTLGMRLSCNFVNVYTIVYHVQ